MYKIPASTLFLGKNLVFVPECHSTNTLALELCQQSCPPEGTVIITNHQTSGRGQRGNTWESEPGMNLTFSLILKPTFLSVKNQFLLSMVTSLAISDFVAESIKTPVRIKWPNDIFVNEFKIAGILIENQLTGDRFNNTVIGVGLNVNQKRFAAVRAASLSTVADKRFDLQSTLEGLLAALEVRYLQLRQNKAQQLRDDYLEILYGLNKPVKFTAAGSHFTGQVAGVDDAGKLLVEINGREKAFDIKEISFVN